MNKSKIEWCDSTWNPVTGCLHNCEYCYARKIANRFGTIGKLIDRAEEIGIGLGIEHFINPDYFTELDEPVRDENGKIEPYPENFYPMFHRYRLNEPQKWKKPRTIFVCSMADLFGDWVSDEWIKKVFDACAKAPQHRYLFLTKNPHRYAVLNNSGRLPLDDNMWYGSTMTNCNNPYFFSCPNAPWFSSRNTFLSIEPIQRDFSPGTDYDTNWIVIGAEMGNRKGKSRCCGDKRILRGQRRCC